LEADRRKGTATSSFGVSKRESHDSSQFYSRRLYDASRTEAPSGCEEREVPVDILDGVHCLDSRDMSVIPEESVHLMVTSPPYNVVK